MFERSFRYEYCVDSTYNFTISGVLFLSNVPKTIELIEVFELGFLSRLSIKLVVEPVLTLNESDAWDSVVFMMTSISADEAKSSY